MNYKVHYVVEIILLILLILFFLSLDEFSLSSFGDSLTRIRTLRNRSRENLFTLSTCLPKNTIPKGSSRL